MDKVLVTRWTPTHRPPLGHDDAVVSGRSRVKTVDSSWTESVAEPTKRRR
ncbi:hypothetical protein GL213_01830 [Halogeometricum borinquense]|uniref:Uncharacterized protein n=1 Tax=Halogeometricum borinquense TaxID=60847 RepID=A0A6C0UP45_9EURY|nr:hypothetical protein [Halogeometricum borinquense]QIB76171.1 hypothetical protein G3I44_19010 [Halogeometricum borinquense]QIQ75388.1 hypothetical protein GL213_01830 [Halogeometricum borinquense]